MTRLVENRVGVLVSVEALETSTGFGDAGRIPQLDAAGLLDPSLFPASGLSVDWGAINGTLSDQVDLQAALDAKIDDSQGGVFGLILLGTADVAAAKMALAYVKADVGLNLADNTADADKNVLSATKWTTGRTITTTGDATGVSGAFDGSGNLFFALTVVRINGVSLAGLATGILKNTTTTGAPSIAAAGDFPTLNQNTTGSAATLTTPRNIDGQAFNGSTNITVIAPGTNAAVSKATPVDADELPLVDSAASNVLKKLTWANLKATLKTYFDTLYQIIPAAWSQTTPTPTPSAGAFTATSQIRVSKAGKTVNFSVAVSISDNGTAPLLGLPGYIDVAMPHSSVNSGKDQSFGGREAGATGVSCGATILNNSTTMRMQRYDGTYMGAAGYVLEFTGAYEAV